MAQSVKRFSNIYITGDVLRPRLDGYPEQLGNINWLFEVIGKQLEEATAIQPKKLIPQMPYNTSQIEWLKQFDPDFPSWHLQQRITRHDLIVGFELPCNTVKQLEDNRISYINVAFSPIRYLDDLVMCIRHNFYEKEVDLLSCVSSPVTDETFYIYANRLRLQLSSAVNNSIPSNSALIVGQTRNDRSLVLNGEVLNLQKFQKQIKELIRKHSEVYFKPHPYYRDGELVRWIEELGMKVTEDNIYQLLSNPNIEMLYGISSCVLHEAKYFGKEAKFFGSRDLFNRFIPVSATDFLSVRFWALLLSIPGRNHDVVRNSPPNFLRKLCNSWWGYGQWEHENNSEKCIHLSDTLEKHLQPLVITDNYIKAGINEDKQVLFGRYDTEIGTNGDKAFWTDKVFQACLKPNGTEGKLEFVFATGSKCQKIERYGVNLLVIDDETKAILVEHSADYQQRQWLSVELPLPPLANVQRIRVEIRSDTFVPKELGENEDCRRLGIILKTICLK